MYVLIPMLICATMAFLVTTAYRKGLPGSGGRYYGTWDDFGADVLIVFIGFYCIFAIMALCIFASQK